MTFVDEFDEHFVKDVIDIPVDYTQWQRETKKKNQQPDEKRCDSHSLLLNCNNFVSSFL